MTRTRVDSLEQLRFFARYLIPDAVNDLKKLRTGLSEADAFVPESCDGSLFRDHHDVSKLFKQAITELTDLRSGTIRSLQDAADGLDVVVDRYRADEQVALKTLDEAARDLDESYDKN